jgi:two-component system, NarL family, capsular synthesis sensor histidine kinase RcsC
MNRPTLIYSVQNGDDLPPRIFGDEAKGGRATKTILVAESDRAHRASVAELLLGLGCSVILTANGDDALTFIGEGTVDLLVTAISLDDQDGLELLQAMRDARIKLPIVVITSGVTEIDSVYLRAAAVLGAACTFARPLTSATFLASVCELLGQSPG